MNLFEDYSVPMKLGVDISGTWQGLLDWKKAKDAGVQFALIKATNGANGQTPLFRENLDAANAEGILTIAYHYILFNEALRPQIANIRNTLTGAPLTMKKHPLMLDFEDKGETDRAALNNYACKLVKGIYDWMGIWPIVYTNRAWWEWSQIPWWNEVWGQCPLDAANWTDAVAPLLPRNAKWTQWLMWQWMVASNGDDFGVEWKPGSPRPKIDLQQWGNLEPWPGDNPQPPQPPAGKWHVRFAAPDGSVLKEGDL